MSRRKSVAAKPEAPATVLRRSARLIIKEGRELADHEHASGIDKLLGSDHASSPAEGGGAVRKCRGDFRREDPKSLVYPFSGSVFGTNSRKSPGSNGSIDGHCTRRRSPRFLSMGNLDTEIEKSTRCGSGKFSVSSLDSMNSITLLRKCKELNSSNHESCTLRRSPRFLSRGNPDAETEKPSRCGSGKSSVTSLDRMNSASWSRKSEKLNSWNHGSDTLRRSPRFHTSEGKKRESRKLTPLVNEFLREEENIMSSSGRATEFLGPSKGPEIVSGLCAKQGTLTVDRRTVSSFRRQVVKADGDEGKTRDLIDARSEKDRLKMENKCDGVGNCGIVQGWTKEQELALQSAYFTAKPSPHFWKKVSKLVPGKSAQECFDKVHSDLTTPNQPPPRSRVQKGNLSPIAQFSLSASKLLKPTPKSKIPAHSKKRRKSLAQKTIRHLLEKQCHVDQAHELDLFSVFEPTTKSNVPSTPMEEGGNPQKIQERSSSGHKRPCLRSIGTGTTTLNSPPVLKRIKNQALHEKYIDQLHFRETKRKTESARLSGKENAKPNPVNLKRDSVRAAKDALIFDVKDAMEKLKGLEADNSCSSPDFCYDHDDGEEADL